MGLYKQQNLLILNTQELHYDFKLKLDKIDSLSMPDFNIAQIDWLLNEAQDVFTKQRYQINNVYQSGFEASQKRYDDLKSLHIKFPLQPALTLTNLSGVYELALSDLEYDYWFLTRATVETFDQDACVHTAIVKMTQSDDLSEALRDPFNSPHGEEIPGNFGRSSSGTGSSLYLYPGTLVLGRAYVEYIKRPRKMYVSAYTYIDGTTTTPQDCELPEHTHSEIVDIAVQLASSITQNPSLAQASQFKLLKHE